MKCTHEGGVVEAFLPNPGTAAGIAASRKSPLSHERGGAGQPKDALYGRGRRTGRPAGNASYAQDERRRPIPVEKRLIPGLEGALLQRSEVAVGGSRFDFLLKDGKGEMLLEVKSCTLFGKRVAMSPDAVTARGPAICRNWPRSRGVARGRRSSSSCTGPSLKCLCPTTIRICTSPGTLLAVHESMNIIPVAVRWQQELSLADEATLLDIPWHYIEKEAHDRGGYILILELSEDHTLPIGRRGEPTFFRKGYYLYVGSAMVNLSSRIERHLRLRKRFHWHIDWLRSIARVRAVLPIRASVRLECDLAAAISRVADWSVPGFGCSDCDCDTHLFCTAGDPLCSPDFHRLLQFFRMDRYDAGSRETNED